MATKTFRAQEKDVLGLLRQGKSSRQITEALGVPLRTVETLLKSIYEELRVASRPAAVGKLSASPRDTQKETIAGRRRNAALKKGGGASQPRDQRRGTLFRTVQVLILVTLLFAVMQLLSGDSAADSETSTPIYYYWLDPATIQKDEMRFAAAVHLTCTELTFNLNGTFPQGFATQFPNSQIPPLYAALEIAASVDGVPLALEAYAGGGGGGSGDFDSLGQGRSYRVLTPLSNGQAVKIIASVIFNDYIGIPQPVLFKLYPLVEGCGPTPTPMLYQYLSSNSITKGGMVFTVNARLTLTELWVNVEISGPMEAIASELQARTLYAFTQIQFEFPDPTQTVPLQLASGYGGGPGEGATFRLTQAQGYTVLGSLQIGQTFPVTIFITFDPLAGLPDPVPFSIVLVVGP